MTSNRPYLIRALYEWILDNDCTPYLVVSTEGTGAQVPEAYVENGRIVLNVAPQAVRNLDIDNEYLSFDGRFGGQPHRVVAPVGAVMAIYAKETGQGTVFEVEVTEDPPPSPDDDPSGHGSKDGGGGGHLRIVK
jgi:stringent starvation protein B